MEAALASITTPSTKAATPSAMLPLYDRIAWRDTVLVWLAQHVLLALLTLLALAVTRRLPRPYALYACAILALVLLTAMQRPGLLGRARLECAFH